MIVEAFVNLIVSILLGVISLFPTIPHIKTEGIGTVFQFLTMVNTFVNLGVFVSCMVVIFIFKNIEIVWSAVMWVVRKIPSIE